MQKILSPRVLAGAATLALILVIYLCVPGRVSQPRPVEGRQLLDLQASPDDPRIPSHRTISVQDREQYLGSAACIACHQNLSGQPESRHGKTLAPVSLAVHGPRFQQALELMDVFQSIDYRVGVRDGRCVLTANDGTRTEAAPADYAFGSGAIGETYVGYVQGEPIELRLTYYRKNKQWDFTPGAQVGSKVSALSGQKLSAREEEACFRCHTTALVQHDGKLDLQRSILGVECEACHGPGRAHVEAARLGRKDLQMAHLADLREKVSLQLCGQCHRGPDAVNMASPGMANQLPRLQGVALSRSECFTKGGVTCLSCHDAHSDVRETSRPAYNLTCSSCHTPGNSAQVACRTAPRGDCVSCHMPAQDVGMPTSPKFHNHWIKVWGPGATEKQPENQVWIPEPD
jgi:hypothetical protein